MAMSSANSDGAGSARLPQLDPHTVWAQAGRGPERAAPQTDVAPETAMAEPQFAPHHDDDLPITLRRERDARRQAANGGHAPSQGYGDLPPGGSAGDAPPVTVTAFDVPFGRMVLFFVKAVFAAIPALLLLGALLFVFGQALQTFLPWLVKMRIVITFPG
jgi:hypothetical protein